MPFVTIASALAAQDPAAATTDASFVANNVWMLMSALLVFIMHLGFATLEAGLTRAQNVVNILFKNLGVVAVGTLTYALVGFSLMYPGEAFAGGLFGFAGFGIGTDAAGLTPAYNPSYTYWTDFIFQAMFAATAATIISGAVAERIKLKSFLFASTIYVGLVYPIVGMWHWGGGWLAKQGFYDFAGSTIVHGVGGWAALVGAFLLGPRLGKIGPKGETRALMGHNLPLATIGVFLLWFGWFGFNGGSVLSADPAKTSLVFVTTMLGAAAGVVMAMVVTFTLHHKPDLTMVLNGALAGLVGITAGADVFTPLEAIAVGGIAGILVIGAIVGIEKLKLDDPVGAVPVHLVCGVWGTLAVGLFTDAATVGSQLMGIAAVGVACALSSFAIFFATDKLMGLRVSREEEELGLDITEHGMSAYTGFSMSSTAMTVRQPLSRPSKPRPAVGDEHLAPLELLGERARERASG